LCFIDNHETSHDEDEHESSTASNNEKKEANKTESPSKQDEEYVLVI
jgi:hypothetical protein